MLSDAEQRRLAAIESSLQADDPKFVRRFNAGFRRRRGQLRAARIGFAASLVAVVTALAFGSVVVAIVALVAAGAGAGLWITLRTG
jgi:hypothetical protein